MLPTYADSRAAQPLSLNLQRIVRKQTKSRRGSADESSRLDGDLELFVGGDD
mgnify:CR=1 FL=1